MKSDSVTSDRVANRKRRLAEQANRYAQAREQDSTGQYDSNVLAYEAGYRKAMQDARFIRTEIAKRTSLPELRGRVLDGLLAWMRPLR